jgi:quercetin dioxygenase-like cupin family protein
MSLQLRRVITGHDANGKAVVKIDEICTDLKESRPGAQVAAVWSTDTLPANNDGQEDEAKRETGTTLRGGSVFRVVQFHPGVTPRNHRTDSIDYAVVMSGEIDMDLDGQIVTLRQGDVMVQRGTIHNWINRGREPCTIAFSLIDAKPVEVNGKRLDARG